MSAPRCSRLWQAEAITDGRLSHPDAAAFERHAASCAECAREIRELEQLRQLTAQLPASSASDLERRRQRHELLRMANEATVHAPRSRARVVGTFVIGAALVTAATALGMRAVWPEPAAAPNTTAAPVRAASKAVRRNAVESSEAPQPETEERALEDSVAPTPTPVPAPAPAPRVRSKPVPPPLMEDPPRAGAAFAKAMAAFTAGDYASAQALFAAFEREHGDDDRVEDALFLRAVAHARRGDLAESRATASEYLKRYPSGLRKREAEQLAR
jgi:TolA-binding protein